MKGILLAGGSGTRLHPLTRVVSKQLLPICRQSQEHVWSSTLSTCFHAAALGIRQILVISTPTDTELFRRLLGDGHQLGLGT